MHIFETFLTEQSDICCSHRASRQHTLKTRLVRYMAPWPPSVCNCLDFIVHISIATSCFLAQRNYHAVLLAEPPPVHGMTILFASYLTLLLVGLKSFRRKKICFAIKTQI